MLIALIVAFAWALVCLLFDAYNTNKGISAGIAVEGNPLIVAIFGNKPKFWQLLAVDGTIRAAMLAAALYLPEPSAYPLSWYVAFTSGFFIYGLKNIQGGRQWQWMSKNPGKKLPEANTFWEKLIGFWG